MTNKKNAIGRCDGCKSPVYDGIDHTCPAKRAVEHAYKTNLHGFVHYLNAGFSHEEAARLACAEEIEA